MHQNCKFVDSIWKLDALEKFAYIMSDWGFELGSLLLVSRLDIYLNYILPTLFKA